MKDKIVIFGGELQNKGAQAMTFTLVNELSERFPGCKIVLVSHMDFQNQGEKYKFEIIDFDSSCLVNKNSLLLYLLRMINRHKKDAYRVFHEVMNEAKFIVDISGYALASSWGILRSVVYLYQIKYAKMVKIPIYLFPQSFGPFDYPIFTKGIMKYFIKKYLQYPSIIYAREKEGFDLLTQNLKLKNVLFSPDMVLLNKQIDFSSIYKEIPSVKEIKIKEKSVAILPNVKTIQHGTQNMYSIYKKIVEELLKKNFNIYLMSHSTEDFKLCKQIENSFQQNHKISLIKDELSCIEYTNIVGQFDFVIASRYHAIVHAYKEDTPCIVIGWARKYYELAELFKQGKYLFDVRKGIDIHRIEAAIQTMEEKYEVESIIIKEIKENLQNTQNIFEIIKE